MSCILWTGSIKDDYGQKYRRDFKTRLVHRQVYCDHHGLTEDDIIGLCVRHTCDTPLCVNPEHLLIGTHADNMRDKALRRRTRGDKATRKVLTQADADHIRTLWPGVSQMELARRYGCSATAIFNVVHNVSWVKTEGE